MLRPVVVRVLLVYTLLCTLALALPAAARAGNPPPIEAGDLIGSTGGVGLSIIDIDPGTGAGNLRFNVTGPPVSGLEFRADGVLFATQGGAGSSLITIDPNTGAETLVGMHTFGAVTGLQFIDDTLYGAFVGAPQGFPEPPYSLVTIDQTDGSLTPIGTMPDYFPIRGLAYDVNTATLYGIGIPVPQQPSATAPEGFSDHLFTVNPATAATTDIGPTGFFLGGLEFGPDGLLYAGEEGGGKPGDGADWTSPGGREVVGVAQLVTIDTGTGLGTAVGSTGFPAISALAFYPDVAGPEPEPSVLEIPTLSWLGLALLVVLLAAGGWVAVRRG